MDNQNPRNQPPPDSPRKQADWQPRFGLSALLLTMVLCCILAAGAFYLLGDIEAGISSRLPYILLVVAGPGLLVVGVNVTRALLLWLGRR